MKVLIFGTEKLECASKLFGVALRGMGHEVRYFDAEQHPRALAALRGSWRARKVMARVMSFPGAEALWEPSFVRMAGEYGPNLILIAGIEGVSPRALADAKRASGARAVGWYQDHIVNLGRHRCLLADFDAIFFKDRYIVERLRDWMGATHIHFLPEACEPSLHHSLPISEADLARYGCDLMVYGNPYIYRLRLLERLASRDLRFFTAGPTRWFGHPLERTWQGHEVSGDEKIRAVLAAKIVINNSHFGEIRSTNARTFEVAGIGGFQLSDAPGTPDYFTPGEEIVTFRGPRDLEEKIEHYLRQPEERARIAQRGQERAHREHTMAHRFRTMFRTLGMSDDPGGSA